MQNNHADFLEKSREHINHLDDKILDFLVERFKTVTSIGNYKKHTNTPIIQNNRIQYLIDKAKKVAEKNSINPVFFEKIYKTIIEISCEIEHQIYQND